MIIKFFLIDIKRIAHFNQANIYLMCSCCWLTLLTYTRTLTGSHFMILNVVDVTSLCADIT